MTEKRSPFYLVPDDLPTDIGPCLRELLLLEQRRRLVGIGFVAMVRGRGFIVNTAGECHRNPTFTRGMLAALDDQLALRIRGGSTA